MSAIKKSVIIAEDEPLVRMAAADMLSDAGFEVIEVAHAGEALDAVKARGGEVTALFTDVHMPGGSTGIELAQIIHTQWPKIAILVTSGLHRIADGELPTGTRFVTKPYEAAEIINHIHALMQA